MRRWTRRRVSAEPAYLGLVSMALQPQRALGGTPWSSLASSGVVWEHHPHTVDAVISDEHKIVYIDNVKAGSTTLRSAMEQVLHASWNHGDCCAPELSEDKQTTPLEKERGCHHGPSRSRTTTRCAGTATGCVQPRRASVRALRRACIGHR